MGTVILSLGLLIYFISILCCFAVQKHHLIQANGVCFSESLSLLGPLCPGGTGAGAGGLLGVVDSPDNWEHVVWECWCSLPPTSLAEQNPSQLGFWFPQVYLWGSATHPNAVWTQSLTSQEGNRLLGLTEVICATSPHPESRTFVFTGCCSFSWHAQDINREWISGMLAGPHLYQSLIPIRLQVETVMRRLSTSLFQSCGHFACYTSV